MVVVSVVVTAARLVECLAVAMVVVMVGKWVDLKAVDLVANSVATMDGRKGVSRDCFEERSLVVLMAHSRAVLMVYW